MKKVQTQSEVTIGYARVSLSDDHQTLGLEVQKSALAHCDRIFCERQSGGDNQRPQLRKAILAAKRLSQEEKKVSLVIYKLDRLTRRMVELLEIIEELNAHRIQLVSIKENLETDSLTGKLLCMILGYVAEMELENIRLRTKDGLRKAKEKGVKLGNRGISKAKEKQVIRSYLEEEMTVRDIANQFQISTATIYNTLKRNDI